MNLCAAATSRARFLRPSIGGAKKVRRQSRRLPEILGLFRWHAPCTPGINSVPFEEDTMSADEAEKTLKQELEDTRSDLRQTADEIKLKLHLAGMDAKDAWNEVQPRLADFEQRFDATAEEVGEELKALGSEIMQRLQNIKSKLV
jgi:seryl-tRNA synthetase